MKKIALILTLLLAFSTQIDAQVTAVMKVTVQVVSGSKVVAPGNLILTKENDMLEGGHMEVTSAPKSDIEITIDRKIYLTDKNKTSSHLITAKPVIKKHKSGKYSVSIETNVSEIKNLDGNYEGTIVTTFNYL
jgi:predicted lipoprotein